MPVAVNCLVRPLTTLGSIGVTAMELKVAAVTVSVVLPDLPSRVAVIVAVPADLPVARPLSAVKLGFIVATAMSPDDQVTRAVISATLPSV